MKRLLIIGGTRNLGPSIVRKAIESGWRVAVVNRGLTPDSLPPSVERLRADRGDIGQMRSVLAGRDFDLVVDMTLYNAVDAGGTADLLNGRVGRYLFISSGQVYLVREHSRRPFRERDYVGNTIPAPPRRQEFDYGNWLYGMEKRGAEDMLGEAWATGGFPVVTLRLPMVNSVRDHFGRVQGYVLRLLDGGPILLPEGEHLLLRHVYGEDAAGAIMKAGETPGIEGRAINISQDDALTIDGFLQLVGDLVGRRVRTLRLPLDALESAGVFPACSPFSERWMSELDNELGKRLLGMSYAPYRDYLPAIIDRFLASHPSITRNDPDFTAPGLPEGYAKRSRELELAARSSRAAGEEG